MFFGIHDEYIFKMEVHPSLVGKIFISLSRDNGTSFILNNRAINILDAIVWNRVKLSRDIAIYDNESSAKAMIKREFLSLANDILHMCLCPINPPRASLAVRSRAYQLGVVRRVGFNVPLTLISNDYNRLKRYLKRSSSRKEWVTKSMSSANYALFDDKGKSYTISCSITSPLSSEDIYSRVNEKNCHVPTMLQSFIEKNFDWRVVVIMGRCIPFKIEYDINNYGKYDWRPAQFSSHCKIDRIPEEISEMLLRFCQCVGLAYGVFDLIEDKDGNFWFLECNSEGQWYWLDRVGGGIISDTFAKMLAELARSQHPLQDSGPTWGG